MTEVMNMSADDVDMLGADGSSSDSKLEEIRRHESCRACGGAMSRIDTTYCYSGLLVRELATLGIKVEHKMVDEE